MTPTRRKAEKITKPEKSIGVTGALSSNDAQKASAAGSPTGVPAVSKRPSVAQASKVAKETPKAKPVAEKLEVDQVKPAKLDGATPASAKATAGGSAAAKRPSAVKGGSKKLRVVLAMVVVFVMLVAVAFSWYRWLYGNDTLNIQGEWYVNGSDAIITITEEEIVLSEDVSYTYTLDAVNKSIEFFFSDLAGCGHYRFSFDRGELAIIDGECSGADSITSDFAWLMGALFFELQGKEAAPAEGEGAMLLSREPISLVEE